MMNQPADLTQARAYDWPDALTEDHKESRDYLLGVGWTDSRHAGYMLKIIEGGAEPQGRFLSLDIPADIWSWIGVTDLMTLESLVSAFNSGRAFPRQL